MKIAQHIILAGVAALAAGCSNEPTIDTLSPDGTPTPLVVSATINDAPQSRAHDKTFEAGDQLLTYIRHVVDDGSGNYTSIVADQAPRLVTLKVNDSFTMTPEDPNTDRTSDLTIDGGLYWDDFNDSSAPDTDLRTANHYLQSFYGYCYNGGTPSTALTEATGVLSWTLPQNFDVNAMKKNDLLWSPTQPVISYKHDSGTRGTLTVPYTHAMSKFTIVVKGGEGFAAGDLDATTATLQNMLKEAAFTAPNGGYAPTADTWATAGMYLAGKSGLTNTYTALAIPGRVLTTGETLVVIDNADGNKYEIKLTDAILGATAWGAQLDGDKKTLPGVNYQLTVTINKQKIEVIAKITDWTDVLATGDAEIKFDSDITDSGITGDTFTVGDEIDIFHNQTLASLTYTTTSTLTAGIWVNDPQIYWENGFDTYYFRALTEYDKASGKYISVSGSNAIAEAHDLLWGTTAAHLTYVEGEPLSPRTGDVPLVFRHVMSKITVKLATPTGDAGVVLDGALITINGLHTDGTVDITNGSIALGTTIGDITDFASATHPVLGKSTLDNYVVAPQTLGDEIILKIRLADNTSYSITLNTCCVEGPSTPITAWEQGKHYIYTIGVAKEGIKLIALVKKWKEVLGSGDATLDWD
ncbi:MAG: fimbrillin family protein [Muribaculaceae bacterium]